MRTAMCIFLLASCRPIEPSPPRVTIESGIVEGVAFGAGATFRGIPYAGPPLGAQRFRPPSEVAPWAGVRAARDLGPACPQPPDREPGFQRKAIVALGGDPSVVPPLGPISEDCLSLNIWTPGLAEHRPVIVWIHGGSYAVGTGGEDAASLARLGVVVVTFNYRLGVLGFLAHPALTRESPHGSSGNYGLLDQIAALGWVHRNIAAFGGDPARVMVAGHSAGGGAVLQLIGSPLARGLFSRAVAQSGTLDMSQPLAQAEAEGLQLAAQLGARPDDPLPALRATSVERLLAVSQRGFQGTTDGWAIPMSGPDLLHAGRLDAMPLIIGATASEADIFAFTPPETRDDYRQLVSQADPARADRVLAHYPVASDADAARAMRRYLTDRDFVCPARYVAARRRGPTWLYLYSAPLAPGARHAAFHGAELRPLFDQRLGAPLSAVDQRIGEAMRRYWVRFAATGDPNQPGLPDWPTYGGSRPRHLELGDPVRSRAGFDRPGCDVFDESWRPADASGTSGN